MALITEIFGTEITAQSLEFVKEHIKYLASASDVEKATMLKEFAAIRGIDLSAQDFADLK